MGRAILILSLVVICSFTYVVLQLARHRAAEPTAPPGPAPVLQMREDGSVYAVSLQLSQLERRLMEEEQRSAALRGEIDELRRERTLLDTRVQELSQELRRIRGQLSERTRPPAASELPGATPLDSPGPEQPVPAPGVGRPDLP